MKRLTTFIVSGITAILLCSCEKHEQESTHSGNWPVSYGYMQFSTNVSTKANIATNMKGKQFGVIGYKYSKTSNWETSKSVTAPMTGFYNQMVNCGNDGVCTYDKDNNTSGNQLQEWEDNLYSFFAYHPHNGSGISLSSSNATNTPTLTYTYGWLSTSGNISVYDSGTPIYDLMTAEAVDVSGSGEGKVNLNFKHRLFAFEILANNYNENEYEKNPDGSFILDNEGNKIITVNARQKITNLTLTLSGLVNTSMTIPLSMQDGENEPVYNTGTVGSRTFKISDETLTIPAYNETFTDEIDGIVETRGEGVATSISKLGSTNKGYVMLIPQAETNNGITGVLNWTELDDFKKGGNTVNNEFTSTIEFKPGKLYQIYINFVGSGITIALIEAGNWDNHDVTHTFE